jgi:hypothetical protein
MRFEARDLMPYAEPVSAADLREGAVYFSVNYADDEMLIPLVETLIFIGGDLEPGDSGQVYFQDVGSHREGVRYGVATDEAPARFFTGSQHEVKHIFEYEHALEVLMRCSLRRRKAGLK